MTLALVTVLAVEMHGPNLAASGEDDWITNPKPLSDPDIGFAAAAPATAKSSGGFDPNRPFEMVTPPPSNSTSGGISFKDLIPKGH